jgi:hypothetical protein
MMGGPSLHGASDKHGAMPARELGLDPLTELFDPANRPLTIAAGRPISGVWA